jgi:hypothetical protein
MTEYGYVDIGDSGEFVTRLVLYLARMMAVPEKVSYEVYERLKPAVPVSFKSMMECLGTLPEEPKLGESEYLDGIVSFNHFVKLNSLEDDDNMSAIIEQAFARGAALLMPDGNIGVDLIIPIVTKSNALSSVLVQVKNRESVNYAETLRGTLNFAQMHDLTTSFHVLMVLNRETKKNCITRFAASTLAALKKTGHDSKLSGYLVEGVQFSFKPTSGQGLYALPSPTSITDLNLIIADLADSYRGAKKRLTGKFAEFQKESDPVFVVKSKNLETEPILPQES